MTHEAGMTLPKELESYLAALPEPHIVIGDDYRILAANAAYRAAFPGGAQVVGRTCHKVSHDSPVPCDQAGETCPLSRVRQSGLREKVVHLHHHRHGAEYVEIELVPITLSDGRRVYLERLHGVASASGRASASAQVGRSPAFRQLMERVSRVAPTDANVLLLGESGTGKEMAAKAVHQASARSSGPFVAVDCAALPEGLFESELFGHERGAFTGATSARAGLVESAAGGTLFIDEVGDIPLAMQVKLLRLLESGTFRRVGSNEIRRAEVRIVSATHRDLQAMVAEGRFRQDLYFRLATFPIRIPALRERREDIPLLARSLLERLRGAREVEMSDAALGRLGELPLEGNIRELRNLVERALIFCDGGVLEARHVDDAVALESEIATSGTPSAAPPKRRELARRLGISERTLYRRLRAHRGETG